MDRPMLDGERPHAPVEGAASARTDVPRTRPASANASLHMRPVIRDLDTDNIADLATRAGQIKDCITLWYGEGDVVTPPFIREAATAALEAGKTFYEPNMRGWPPLTEALSDYQTRLHGRPIAVKRSTVTPGGMQALALAMQMICDPGRNVVYLEPQWPNIRRIIHLNAGEPRAVPLTVTDADLSLDMERVKDACDARTCAIVLSTPSNPSGWTASRAELRELLEFTRERGLWLISDECYNRLWYGEGESAPSIMEIAQDEDRVLTINTFSKSWAMTGWRVGWLGHPVSCAPTLGAMTQYINSGTATFVQAGARTALVEGEGLVADIRERTRAGLDTAFDLLGGVDRVTLPQKPPGGMYAFFRIEGEEDSREACRMLLDEARVGLAPGFMFGEASRAFLRMCVCRETAQVREACERIAAALS